MKNQIEDLLDIPRLQCALDSLYASSKIPSAIIDNAGKVHTGSGWQDVCTKFHRVHPEARKRCIESDTYIADHIREANPSITYKCPHGLVDAATPIIIEGEHIGNVFTGQLFLEAPDLDSFRAQAKAFGFDEETIYRRGEEGPDHLGEGIPGEPGLHSASHGNARGDGAEAREGKGGREAAQGERGTVPGGGGGAAGRRDAL